MEDGAVLAHYDGVQVHVLLDEVVHGALQGPGVAGTTDAGGWDWSHDGTQQSSIISCIDIRVSKKSHEYDKQ